MSRYSLRMKYVSGMLSYFPHAIGFGTSSGVRLWMAFMDSCSLLSMSRPISLDCTLMKKVQGEPSASSTSILPVLAQKLVP
jgi:hypothetical protein